MTFEKVRKIVAKNLSIDENKITLESDFVADLGADSIDLVEIYMDLEDELFKILDDEIKEYFEPQAYRQYRDYGRD